MIRAFDVNQDMTPYAGAILNGGWGAIGRYVNRMTTQEAEHFRQMKLPVFLFFEKNPTVDSYFTYNQGVADGNAAVAAFRNLGYNPALGRPIFFTVDEDLSFLSDALSYYNGIRSILEPLQLFLPGCYGPGDVCQYLVKMGQASFTCLAESTGWGGYESWKPNANIVQTESFTLTLGESSFDVDGDLIYEEKGDVLWSSNPLHSGEPGIG